MPMQHRLGWDPLHIVCAIFGPIFVDHKLLFIKIWTRCQGTSLLCHLKPKFCTLIMCLQPPVRIRGHSSSHTTTSATQESAFQPLSLSPTGTPAGRESMVTEWRNNRGTQRRVSGKNQLWQEKNVSLITVWVTLWGVLAAKPQRAARLGQGMDGNALRWLGVFLLASHVLA